MVSGSRQLPVCRFSKRKEPPATESAAPSIDKDAKTQAALEHYLKEEGHAKCGPRFFDLATTHLGSAAQRKPPIPEKAIVRYLGNPELVSYTGTKDALDKWTEKTTLFAYAVDNLPAQQQTPASPLPAEIVAAWETAGGRPAGRGRTTS